MKTRYAVQMLHGGGSINGVKILNAAWCTRKIVNSEKEANELKETFLAKDQASGFRYDYRIQPGKTSQELNSWV